MNGLTQRIVTDVRLLPAWAGRELRVRYRGTRIGVLWALIQPLAMLAVFGYVFSRVLHVSTGAIPYLSFAFAGVVAWAFLASSLNAATTSLVGEAALVTRAYFQRELLPLGTVAAACIELAMGTAVLLALVLAQGVGLSVNLLGLIPVFAVLLVWAMALAVLCASATVFLRDIRYGLPLVLQLLFVATPIMYPKGLLPSGARWVADVNPIAVVVESTRATVLRHTWPSWGLLAAQAVAGGVLLLGAILYTRRVEMRMADLL